MEQLLKNVRKDQRYPEIARKLGWEGEVLLRVVIRPSGELVEIKVKQSSGREALDQEAVNKIRRRMPFPPIQGLATEVMILEIPIGFQLKDALDR
jgi:protein TonB